MRPKGVQWYKKLFKNQASLSYPKSPDLPFVDAPKKALNISVFGYFRRYLRQVKIYHKPSNFVKFNQFCDQNATNAGGLI